MSDAPMRGIHSLRRRRREIDIFEENVVIHACRRREEAHNLHLFVRLIFEHVNFALGEKDRAACFDRRHLWEACELFAQRNRRFGSAI